jgi:hypothetical protein
MSEILQWVVGVVIGGVIDVVALAIYVRRTSRNDR